MASIAPPPRGIALVVDDDPGVRMCTADVLVDMGYEVVEAESAEEALRALDRGVAPALMVTDHLMPGMTGSALAREVRARHPQTPVIVVSGYTDVELDPGLVLLGKPFRLKELRDCVESATARG
ncbi:response regulator [Pseudoxanthomonas daejeonensis]|uniref:Response regulator n=1 Tax=Pseudoxanthomonas daejeonensis TaxID=266062 RepID=A0ABQ6Z7G1_9GAMM|nr:response regulator [Pseudoxanthomonas daejeonensis]KAF1694994.1 response regulator [Pseudoxanthomonas daejeonensis]UNK56237.1 response regulator [Pseudoxanthomonas daejeonensis]